MSRIRTLVLLGTALLTFGGLNRMVLGYEALLRQGRPVLLALQPRDPRSQMQGDYMALNFTLSHGIPYTSDEILGAPGGVVTVILGPAPNGGMGFRRFATASETLTEDEARLRVRFDGYGYSLPSQSYFIPEGQGDRFVQARYGVFRVAPDGTALLAALADANQQTIPDHK